MVKKRNMWFRINDEIKVQMILAFFTFLTLLFYIVFGFIQQKQTNEALQRADSANYLTRLSLKYVKQSNDLSLQTLKHTLISDSLNDVLREKDFKERQKINDIELRAYIAIDDIKIKRFNLTEDLEYDIYFINTGKTPAYQISCVCNSGFSKNNLSISDISKNLERFDDVDNDNKGAGMSGIIGMKQKLNLNKIDSLLVFNGGCKFYIFGAIIYKDIFGKYHKTRFCRYYSKEYDKFVAYKYYNDID